MLLSAEGAVPKSAATVSVLIGTIVTWIHRLLSR